ncbi:integrase, partial [Pseudomonas aeruginosa]
MPRPRQNKDDAWMPPRVYLGRSAYEYHPKGGGNIRLCDKTSTQAQVWSAWEALMN